MAGKIAKGVLTSLLQTANVTVNGGQPWDVQVHNEQVYNRVLMSGLLGAGESYMDGWWDCARLDEFIYHTLLADIEDKLKKNKLTLIKLFLSRTFNFQTKKRALEVGRRHYDLGNNLFECMLDKRMNYTCGYWKNANNLDDAQLAKLELSCQKLILKPGMRILDIGCGWGGLAKYAVEKYGVNVVGITISQQQFEYAKQNCAGLPIEIRFQDYRDVNEPFDRIVSIGMFEAVGHLNYRTYMEMAHRCLSEEGLFLLHTIGNSTSLYRSNEWISQYIFPNGMLPSIAQIGKSIEGLFVMEDWHNFGADYDKTLMAWHHNFTQHWDTYLKSSYDQRFYRMWCFYLLSCAGAFRARDMHLWQIVLSKNGIKGGYQAVR